jgi:hypothetical protein
MVLIGGALPFLAAHFLGPSGPVLVMPLILPAFFGGCFVGLGLGGLLSRHLLERLDMGVHTDIHGVGGARSPVAVAMPFRGRP